MFNDWNITFIDKSYSEVGGTLQIKHFCCQSKGVLQKEQFFSQSNDVLQIEHSCCQSNGVLQIKHFFCHQTVCYNVN